MHARRSLLYVPGDDRHKIEKAISSGADCICLDLEDGVAQNKKTEARRVIAEALHSLDFCLSEKTVRINPVSSGLESGDLESILPTRPDGIVLPKAESLDHVIWLAGKLEDSELLHGWPLGSIRILVDVETARGMINLKEIASHSRLDALIFGAEDYALSIGAERTSEAWEVFTSRSLIVMHARAYGLQAIDMVTVDYRDSHRFYNDAVFGAQLGYTGKQVIHPAQVRLVQDAFTPTEAAIEKAKEIIACFEDCQKVGKGAFGMEGMMVDMPMAKKAQYILDQARAAGKL